MCVSVMAHVYWVLNLVLELLLLAGWVFFLNLGL